MATDTMESDEVPPRLTAVLRAALYSPVAVYDVGALAAARQRELALIQVSNLQK
jgi:hypothetical protein